MSGDGQRDLHSKRSEGHKPDNVAGPNQHASPEVALLPSPSSNELAASIQSSVAEIAVMWMLHSWSLASGQKAEPLHLQIKNFSAAGLAAIAAHCPMLRSAKQEHLWMIYFKGLLAADTHPREQMIKAIKIFGEHNWIQASNETAADRDVKAAHRNLSDHDTLEHIELALRQADLGV